MMFSTRTCTRSANSLRVIASTVSDIVTVTVRFRPHQMRSSESGSSAGSALVSAVSRQSSSSVISPHPNRFVSLTIRDSSRLRSLRTRSAFGTSKRRASSRLATSIAIFGRVMTRMA